MILDVKENILLIGLKKYYKRLWVSLKSAPNWLYYIIYQVESESQVFKLCLPPLNAMVMGVCILYSMHNNSCKYWSLMRILILTRTGGNAHAATCFNTVDFSDLVSAAVTGKEVLLLHYISLLAWEPPWSTCGLLQITVRCSTWYKVKADDFLSKGT